MEHTRRFAWLTMAAPLLLGGAAVYADGIPINITNDGTDDIMVTIYDTTVAPRSVVMSQRISGFTTVPISLASDPTGHANLAWTAVTTDPDHRRCGHANRRGLVDSASVNVHANSLCHSAGS